MTLKVTVLGSAGSYCGPGRACSGYLVEDGTARVLVDAGNGSTANLQRYVDLASLDAVVVSHRHVDHCVDLIGAYYALRFGGDEINSVPLYAAPQVMDTLTGAVSNDTALAFTEVFRHTEVTGGSTIEVGGMRFDFHDSIHSAPTVSMRISSGGRTLAYSADSAGGDQLVRCADDADLFLCEATWQGSADRWPPGMHLVASEAGVMANRADVARLVLTHVAGGSDVSRSVEEASATFAGPIVAAEDNEVWTV